MKKLIPLLLALPLLIFMTSCQEELQKPVLALRVAEVIDYNTSTHGNPEAFLIYSKDKIDPLESFESDATILTPYPSKDLFESEILNSDIFNTFIGDPALYTEKEVILFRAMAKTVNHDIIGPVIVFENPEATRIYAYYDLNVNLSSPSYLVEYDFQNRTLRPLGKWTDTALKEVSFAQQNLS